MKTTKLVATLGVATFATAILGTTVVQADDSTTTKGRVEFVESDNQGIVDPTKPGPNPEVVVPPVDPETGEPEVPEIVDGNSSLILFADLDFGTHKVTKVATKYSAQQSKTNVWKDTEGKTLTGTDFENYGKDGVLPQFLQLRTTKDAAVLTVKAQLSEFKLLDGTEVATGDKAKTLDITNITFSNVKQLDNTIKGSTTNGRSFELSPTDNGPKDVATFAATNDGRIRSLIFGKMEEAPDAGLETDQGNNPDAKYYYNNGIQLNLPNVSNMKAGEKYKAELTWTLAPGEQPGA